LLADLHIVAAMIGEVGEIKPRPQVKEKLLKTIKPEAAETPFLSIRANEGDWKPIAPGVQVKILFTDRERRTMTMLMKMAAGSQLEEHRHHGAEELFVLEGDCFSAGQTLSAGDYHRAAPGSSHGVTSTKNGCLMLVISPLAA
jgi:anti-sigma factor ChrR (cupin superfamily)